MTSGSCGGELDPEKPAELKAIYGQAPLKTERNMKHQETDEIDGTGYHRNRDEVNEVKL